MATLREIKNRIASIKKTEQITKALKMVAAVKLRRAQQRILQARPYAQRLRDMMGHIASTIDRELHPLLAIREPEHVCFVIVSSDQGLCGAFNQNIIRKTEKEFSNVQNAEYRLVLIGKKSRDHFAKQEHQVIGEYIDFFRDLQFSHAAEIARRVNDLYTDHKLDRVFVIYNEFKSAAQQQVIIEQLLPIIPITPSEKKYFCDYVFEPDALSILNNLCPQNLTVQIWRILLESFAAEMGARMTAMQSATENADKLITELTMKYNRARQESITKEILDIVSGSEALK